MPCQCTVVGTSSEFVTSTRTCSPRSATSVGPRYEPSNPQVSLGTPGSNSVVPDCASSEKTRVPSASTVESASAGIASGRSKSTSPTVETGAGVTMPQPANATATRPPAAIAAMALPIAARGLRRRV